MSKRITLNPLTNARRTASNEGGGGGALEDRVETLETKVAGLEEYSTLEVNTGKEWIDGKSIYRRVIDFDDPVTLESNSWKNIGLYIGGPYYDSIVSAIGYFKASHGGGGMNYEMLPVGLRLNVTGTQTIEGIAPLSFQLDRLVIEYTKFND